jgi:hypothetical protein
MQSLGCDKKINISYMLKNTLYFLIVDRQHANN